MIYTLKNRKVTVDINSLGAEVLSVRDESGYDYVWSGDAWRDHAPLLFPVCGRLLGGKYLYRGKEYLLSPHGFAKKSEFELIERTDEALKLRLVSNESTRECYPFDFILEAEYALCSDRLKATFTVTNSDEKVMPYMFGWHPGFTLWGDADIGEFSLDFGNKDPLTLHPLQNGCFVNPSPKSYPLNNGCYYINDDELTEVDTLIFKDTQRKVTLSRDGGDGKGVELSWSDNIPYFCVWKAPGKDVRFICLEPWSDVPSDGFTEENFDVRKMSRLSPSESESYLYTVKFN